MNRNLTGVAIFSLKVVSDLIEEIAIPEEVVTDLAVDIAIRKRSRWKLTNQRLAVKHRSS